MKTVVLLSGGMDSTVLACELKGEGHNLHAISFDYGQRHDRELNAANAVAKHLRLPHRIVRIDLAGLAPTSSQTNRGIDVPLGHYTDESMRATVVPNRNMVMLSLAMSYAIALSADAVAYAAHKGDHAIYPDCRPEFVRAMKGAAMRCHYYPLLIVTPFLKITKDEIAKIGATLKAPFHLTYSCYQGEAEHCGECGTCVERIEAFSLAGISDPTKYKCRPAPAA